MSTSSTRIRRRRRRPVSPKVARLQHELNLARQELAAREGGGGSMAGVVYELRQTLEAIAEQGEKSRSKDARAMAEMARSVLG